MLELIAGQRSSLTGLLLPLGDRTLVLPNVAVAELIEGYDRVVGMSATMLAAADELQQLYGIDVVAVPPHTPCIRDDRPTRLYLTGDDRDAGDRSLRIDGVDEGTAGTAQDRRA